jgi:hypothetical protein
MFQLVTTRLTRPLGETFVCLSREFQFPGKADTIEPQGGQLP